MKSSYLILLLFLSSSYTQVYAVDFSVLLGTWNIIGQGELFDKPKEMHSTLNFTEAGPDAAFGYNQNNTPIVATWSGLSGQFKISFSGSNLIYFVSVVGDKMTGEKPDDSIGFKDWVVNGTRQQNQADIKGTWIISNRLNSYIHSGTMVLDSTELGLDERTEAEGLYYKYGSNYGIPIKCTQTPIKNDYLCIYQYDVINNTGVFIQAFSITFFNKTISGYSGSDIVNPGETSSEFPAIEKKFYPVFGYKVSDESLSVQAYTTARYNIETGNVVIPEIKVGNDYFKAEISGPYNIISASPIIH